MHQIIFGKRIFVIDVNLASNDSKLWWWMSHKPDAVFGHIQRYMNHHSILRNNLLYGWEALLRLLMAGCVSSVIPCLFSPKLVLWLNWIWMLALIAAGLVMERAPEYMAIHLSLLVNQAWDEGPGVFKDKEFKLFSNMASPSSNSAWYGTPFRYLRHTLALPTRKYSNMLSSS